MGAGLWPDSVRLRTRATNVDGRFGPSRPRARRYRSATGAPADLLRKESKSLDVSGTQRDEVAVVECRQLGLVKSLRDGQHRSVDISDASIGIPVGRVTNPAVVGGDEVLNHVRAVRHVIKSAASVVTVAAVDGGVERDGVEDQRHERGSTRRSALRCAVSLVPEAAIPIDDRSR